MLNNNSINASFGQSKISLWTVLDWIFPPFCCNCRRIGFEICRDCWDGIERFVPSQVCHTCGKWIPRGDVCAECRSQPPSYDQIRSWAYYQGAAKQIVTSIKYDRRFGLIPYLAPALAECIRTWGISFDFITAVPLGKKRHRERGYNQADLIAQPVAKILDHPYHPQALARVHETRTQVGLDATERQANLSGAFQADEGICSGKSVLLIDDISTTGATLNACSEALKQAGAKTVHGFTVARTNLSPNQKFSDTEVRK